VTKSEAMKIVCVLFGSFPNARFTDQNFESYSEGIIDLDAQTCGAAVQRIIRTHKFNSVPAIAEIREAATAQQHGPCVRGEEAWGTLMLAKRRHGYDYGESDAQRRLRDPLFTEPHITKCLDMFGGWNSFALQDDDAPARARFIAIYDEFARRERADLVSGHTLPAPALGRGGKAALQLVQRNNDAVLGVQEANGAAGGSPAGVASRPAASTTPAAPAAPIAPPRPKPGPTPFQRRVSLEELDAELARIGGAQ
jgi:hypothetical protein